jgi:hypothetical protein
VKKFFLEKRMKRLLFFVPMLLIPFQTGCEAVLDNLLSTMDEPSSKRREKEVQIFLDSISVTPETQKPSPVAEAAVELIKKVGGQYELSESGELLSVSISGDEMSANMFDVLAKQQELVELKITKIQNFNDDNLKKLTGLKKITKLTINNSAITDKSVSVIADSFPNLQRLDLSRNIALTDDSVVYIAKLRELEELILIYCSFTNTWLPELAKLPKLRALDIRGNLQIDNKGLGILAGLPLLKSLKHSSTAIDDNGIKLLTAAKNLETLDIQDFAISDAAGNEFKKIPKLTSLLIYRCTNFGSAGFLALGGKSLKRITLRDMMSIDDDGLVVFRELSTLKRLYLQELDSVSDEGMRNLIYLKELETLEIRNLSQISDKTTEFIARLPNLKSISITGTQLTDKSADLLLSLPNLKELNLKNNTSITDNTKTKLRNSDKFTKLELDE